MSYLMDGETSERLLFRKLNVQDFDALLPYYQNPESKKFKTPDEKSDEELCKYLIQTILNRYEKENGLMALEEKETGNLIGLCGLLIQEIDGEQVIEIGYHILPSKRRRGYASEAAIKCKEYAFNNKLCTTVVSIIHKDNNNSKKVARNNGMVLLKKTVWRENPVEVFQVINDL